MNELNWVELELNEIAVAVQWVELELGWNSNGLGCEQRRKPHTHFCFDPYNSDTKVIWGCFRTLKNGAQENVQDEPKRWYTTRVQNSVSGTPLCM